LWIIPAWPIASLSIDRLFRLMNAKIKIQIPKVISIFYWLVFLSFFIYMLYFVYPTMDKSLTIMALALCAFLILTPVDQRAMLFTFLAGSGLGYFLELWGTTRYCWMYYTGQTPPFFCGSRSWNGGCCFLARGATILDFSTLRAKKACIAFKTII
jgi:hypothetical protein